MPHENDRTSPLLTIATVAVPESLPANTHTDLLADELNSHYHGAFSWLCIVTSQYGQNGYTE